MTQKREWTTDDLSQPEGDRYKDPNNYRHPLPEDIRPIHHPKWGKFLHFVANSGIVHPGCVTHEGFLEDGLFIWKIFLAGGE